MQISRRSVKYESKTIVKPKVALSTVAFSKKHFFLYINLLTIFKAV